MDKYCCIFPRATIIFRCVVVLAILIFVLWWKNLSTLRSCDEHQFHPYLHSLRLAFISSTSVSCIVFLSYFICCTGLFGVWTACVFVFHVRYVESEFLKFIVKMMICYPCHTKSWWHWSNGNLKISERYWC